MGKENMFRIRLLKIELQNFKNIENGSITFPSYHTSKKNGFGKGQDVVGVYGQNGSGKTALIEALIVWQLLQQERSVPEEYGALLKRNAQIQLLFQLSNEDTMYQVKHSFTNVGGEVDVLKPNVLIKVWEDGHWSRWRKTVQEEVKEALRHYAKDCLWIATPRQLGRINLNMGSTTDFALHENQGISLFEENVLEKSQITYVERLVLQLNIVLEALLPGLQIGIDGKEEQDSFRFHLVAKRYETTFPLQNESGGIKRLLSIMTILVAGYHNPSLCVVIDEVDAGIYEYLLGELLEMMRSGANGQFLFTSHNLRALEVLGHDHIVCSTSNPKNRYIQFEHLRKQHNFRDEYLRSILLGGQKELIYEESDGYSLGYAFRKAGKLYDKA